jgi:hypothetical protein
MGEEKCAEKSRVGKASAQRGGLRVRAVYSV